MYVVQITLVIALFSCITQQVTKKKHHFVTVDEFDNLYIHCIIKPGCKKNKIADMDFGSISVELKTKDLGKECNDELIKFLAKVLKIDENYLSIEKGKSSKETLVLVDETSLIKKDDLDIRILKAWRPLDVEAPDYKDDDDDDVSKTNQTDNKESQQS